MREKLATPHSTPATPGSPRKHNHGNFIVLDKIEKVEVLCPAPIHEVFVLLIAFKLGFHGWTQI